MKKIIAYESTKNVTNFNQNVLFVNIKLELHYPEVLEEIIKAIKIFKLYKYII